MQAAFFTNSVVSPELRASQLEDRAQSPALIASPPKPASASPSSLPAHSVHFWSSALGLFG